MGLDGEPFAIAAPGGIVRGWLVRTAPVPRPTVLVVHGWQSHSGDMLLWAAPMLAAGYHVVVYDALGHGESDPSEFTSIRHLLDDLHAVIAWLRARPETTPGLVLFGHSMGGAAALLAAAAADGAPRAVIAAGAPTDPIDITREWLDARRLPGALLVQLMRPFWRRIVAAPYARLRPIRRIGEVHVPVLLLHGDADRHVSVRHAEVLAAANPRARLVRFPQGDHFNLPEQPGYGEAVTAFLAEAARRS
jgi:pimeloyl-ACP methyl ester carboxylesterase